MTRVHAGRCLICPHSPSCGQFCGKSWRGFCLRLLITLAPPAAGTLGITGYLRKPSVFSGSSGPPMSRGKASAYSHGSKPMGKAFMLVANASATCASVVARAPVRCPITTGRRPTSALQPRAGCSIPCPAIFASENLAKWVVCAQTRSCRRIFCHKGFF